jgi:hypothetical protein
MSTQLITERVASRRRSTRVRAVAALGPLTMLGGVIWAFLQPYRITLLHPHDQGFWWLFVQPPIWILLAGLGFHFFVARPLLDDLEADR